MHVRASKLKMITMKKQSSVNSTDGADVGRWNMGNWDSFARSLVRLLVSLPSNECALKSVVSSASRSCGGGLSVCCS